MFDNLFAQGGLSLERLKSYSDIVAAGGIMAASHNDSNRQSQLSRQLRELEVFFGAELIKRGRGPMRLTEAGRQLHQVSCHALGALEELRQQCAGRPVEFTVGAGESIIQWLLLPRLKPVLQSQPRLRLALENLRTDEVIQQLLEGRIDFGVVGRMEARPELSCAPLGRFEYVLFVPRERMPAGRAGSPPVRILHGLPLAMLTGSAAIRQALTRESERHKLRLEVCLRLSSYPQLVQAVQGLRLAAIMPRLAEKSLDRSEVNMVSLPFLDKLARQLSLVWSRKNAEIRPALRSGARTLATVFKLG